MYVSFPSIKATRFEGNGDSGIDKRVLKSGLRVLPQSSNDLPNFS